MAGAETKGSAFIAAVNALRKMFPPETLERLVLALPPHIAAHVRKPPLPVVWVPAEQWFELLECVHRIMFDGDDQLMSELGRQALMGDLRTIYKVFIKLLSPGYVIERGTRIWDTYSKNSGKLRAEPVGDNACDVHYQDLPPDGMSSAFWAYQCGAVRGAIEATGMKSVEVVILKGGGKSPSGILRCTWS